jgi:lactate 2-monooxygenase
MSRFSAIDLQREIYLQGIAGDKPSVPFDIIELEKEARRRMSKEGFAYIAGGAGMEETMTANRLGFGNWRIRPHMLRDVSRRDISIELFGERLPSPFLLSPIGVLETAHKEADVAVAEAAASLGIPMIFSSQASKTMEECAAVMGRNPRWFQLYWSKSDRLVESFVHRAEACGCSAVVVTLDTTMLGWRIRDLDLAYLPFLRGMGIAQYVSDPVFQQLLDEPDEEAAPVRRKLTWSTIQTLVQMVNNYPGRGFFRKLRSGRPMAAVRKFIAVYSRPSLTWDDLPFLRQRTKLPILLKGILHPDDARRAVDSGVDGLILSNHGGRQIDGAIGAIEALPDIAGAVNGQIPVILDSGVRGGADAFKALALGAKAVCIGRPYAYALAVAGPQGVRDILRAFMADFELTMGLGGCKSIGEITPGMVMKI